ncbi:hypothetical protein [Tolypothrix sp. VBCCA 56010]|uniref:hypothetical protein n=1 Tax=Tolypothrix sp. VBCCA 56010 TaxID=3137731 RepID=UPI003D7C8039
MITTTALPEKALKVAEMQMRRCALIESFSSKFGYLLSGNRNQSLSDRFAWEVES